MLDKVAGCALDTRLGSILVMEADLYMTNEIIYGNCMIQVVREHWLIQEEMYSKQSWLADMMRITAMTG
jgi:hypothetical protein